jgi:hypothetical protein
MKKCEACEGTGELREWEWRWLQEDGEWPDDWGGDRPGSNEALIPLGDNKFFVYGKATSVLVAQGVLGERREKKPKKKPAKKKAGKA